MTDAIGGYYSLELRKGAHYHRNALCLNTGRNCFEYILRACAYTHVYLPYYTCAVMLEPIQRLHISYSFYNIDTNLEPSVLPKLKTTEAFLYTNYYGLKQATVERLAAHYGAQLIVDNAQAFFAPRLDGIDTFYTARKFFGVADGAYLYSNRRIDIELPQDESIERVSHLLKRLEQGAESGFADYQRHEDELCDQPIKRMSRLSECILRNIDYEYVKQRRIVNYKLLQEVLHATNQLTLTLGNAVPMAYPYWAKNGNHLRQQLIANRIYVATYWPNVVQWHSPALEQSLCANLLPLPIDQRYTKECLENMIQHICNH